MRGGLIRRVAGSEIQILNRGTNSFGFVTSARFATDSVTVVVSRRPRDAEAAWRAGTGWRRDRLSRQDGCCWAAPCVPARAPCQSRAAGGAEPGGGGGDGEGLQEGGTGVTGDQAPRGVPMPP